jgi:hypothetical protein
MQGAAEDDMSETEWEDVVASVDAYADGLPEEDPDEPYQPTMGRTVSEGCVALMEDFEAMLLGDEGDEVALLMSKEQIAEVEAAGRRAEKGKGPARWEADEVKGPAKRTHLGGDDDNDSDDDEEEESGGGSSRKRAAVATGKQRRRPILQPVRRLPRRDGGGDGNGGCGGAGPSSSSSGSGGGGGCGAGALVA